MLANRAPANRARRYPRSSGFALLELLVEWRRHPEKMAEFKAKVLAEIEAKKARGEDWRGSAAPSAETLRRQRQQALEEVRAEQGGEE